MIQKTGTKRYLGISENQQGTMDPATLIERKFGDCKLVNGRFVHKSKVTA